MARLARALWAPLSARAILPLTEADRVRYFRLAAIIRSIAIGVFGTALMWSFRDRSPWMLAIGVVWMYPAIVVTWMIIRRSGVLAPHIWLRDILSMTVFAAVVPDYVAAAMMTVLAILAFNCYTVERRTTIVLSIVSVIGMIGATSVNVSNMSVVSTLLFPFAILAIVVPSQMSADTMHRSLAFNASIAGSLQVAMFETIGAPGHPSSLHHLFAPEVRGLPPIQTEAEWLDILHPDDITVSEEIDAAVAAGEDYRVRYRQRGDDGDHIWIEEIGRVEKNTEQVKVLGMTRIVTREVEAESHMTRLDRMVDMVDVSISVLRLVDPAEPTSLTVVWENQMASRIEGASHVGQRLIDFNRNTFDVERHRGLGYMMAEVAAGGPSFRVADAHIRLHGENRLFSIVASPLPDQHCAVVMQDVTELWAARGELERLAFVDPLTGLPNRVKLRQAIGDAPVGSMLFVMDLDRFTHVNEAFGHGCGDQMIIEVGRILADAPEGAIVARLGGDEFGILTPPGVGAQNELVARIFHALTRPVNLPSGLTLQAAASMGITTKNRPEASADELLRQADVALSNAKRFRNTHEVYDARKDTSTPHRMMLLGELRRALVSGELELHHQPAIDTKTGMISSVEALLVWRHPSLGLLSTDELTEMIDLSNLNADIVMHSLREAVRHYGDWQRAGRAVPVSINVNGATIHDETLVARIVETVQRAELPRHAIGIEISEQHLLLGQGISQGSLKLLASAGIWVTIDHFGSAITSLSVLRRSHANALKIDRHGLADLRPLDADLMAAMIAACHGFGVLVAADGADDDETLDWLVTLGIDQVQGTVVGTTVPADEMQSILETHVPMTVRR